MEITESMEIEYELVIEDDDNLLDIDKNPSYRPLTSMSMELRLDEVLTNLHEIPVKKKSPKMRKTNAIHKKRGRKPIRPLDPVKKKNRRKGQVLIKKF